VRFWRSLLLVAAPVLVLAGCTGDESGVPGDADATSIATLSATPTVSTPGPAATARAIATPRQPWSVGEPIHLDTEPYLDVTVTEVTAATALPDRDTLDREGGSFVWERETGRLLFIEGIQYLHLAPGLVDGRPIGVALTALDRPNVRSVFVRLDPVEVVSVPFVVNVSGAPFEAQWDGPARASVSINGRVEIDGRSAQEGEYLLDLETVTLTLVKAQRRVPSSVIQVEETWRAGRFGDVSMLVVDGRRSLNRGDGGLGAELFGSIDRWAESPDGSKLLMVGRRLAVYDVDQDRLWTLGGSADYGFVRWSPGGAYFAATVLSPFENSGRTLVFDSEQLDAVASPDFFQSPADGLLLPPLDAHWAWRWRDADQLLLMSESQLSLLNVGSGKLTTLLDDRRPYDTLAWDPVTSTLAHSRLSGLPASLLELDGEGIWFDIPLLSASPRVGLFDMNWGADGKWLALNTAPGRS
jgi:hypothetical protein